MKHKRCASLKALVFLLGMLEIICGADSLWAQNKPCLPMDLQALITKTLKANPEIKQMAEFRNASRETIRSAGALDNPEVSYIMNNVPTDTFRLNQDPMTQQMIELSQKFPFPGKRRLRSAVAAEQTRADEYTYLDKINEIRNKVIKGYWGLSLAHASYDITERNKKLWEDVVQVMITGYRVGKGNQADVLKAQVELGNYLDRLIGFTQRQESVRADINALSSAPSKAPFPRPQPLQPRPFNLKLDDLLALADSRPQLQSLKAQIDKQEKAVALARKDYFPDTTVSMAYAFRERLGPPMNQSQPDMVTGKVMFDLPIWRAAKIQPRIREEEAKQRAAREAYLNASYQLGGQIKDKFVTLQKLDQQIRLYEQVIIPQSKQTAEASLTAYQVGSQDFARLYQDFITIYAAELQLQEYLNDFEANWADLEWLVGQELPCRPEAKR